MACVRCGNTETRRCSHSRLGDQRWRCGACGRQCTGRSASFGVAGLMRRHWDGRPLRLIGLRAGHLTTRGQPAQLPLPGTVGPV